MSGYEWMSEAACSDADPDLFFPEGKDSAAALLICAKCPVRQECGDYGADIPAGIFGGLTATERRRIQLRGTLARTLSPIEHGTDAGYEKHRHRGEDACDTCKHAHNAADQNRLRNRQVTA